MAGNWDWNQKEWYDHDGKHDPTPETNWSLIVAQTRYGDAMYHPAIIRAGMQEEIELMTVALEHEIPTKRASVRIFCRKVSGLPNDIPLGASKGEETNWCYVEWKNDPQGTVHGRPLHEQRVKELRNKGRQP